MSEILYVVPETLLTLAAINTYTKATTADSYRTETLAVGVTYVRLT